MFDHTTIKISVTSHKGEYLPVSEIFRKVIGIVTNVLYEAPLVEASFIVVSFFKGDLRLYQAKEHRAGGIIFISTP